MSFVVIYRISDSGYDKLKPAYINNEQCLRNAIKVFQDATFHVIADNVSEQTNQMILKYVDASAVHKVSVGHGAGTFNLGLDIALTYPDDTIIYNLENDYIHKVGAQTLIEEALALGAHYCSVYDHPDKYRGAAFGGNPFIDNDGGEYTKVYCTQSSHWKITNSTTMTFASKAGILRQDEKIIRKWTNKGHCPQDFDMFLELRKKGRALMTSIPGYATHGESNWLSPLVDWESIANA